MWKGVVAEFGLRGWDAKVHPCPSRHMPAYGAVIGPTPAPAAGTGSTDGAVPKAITPEPTLPRTDGIDVSKWQGAIDWPKVFGSGIWWVAMQVWDRSTKAPDQRFAANRQHGPGTLPAPVPLPRGGARSQPRSPTTSIRSVSSPSARVMLDAEEPGVTVAMCVSWLQTVEAVTGIPSTVYGGYVAGSDLELERHFRPPRPLLRRVHVGERGARDTPRARSGARGNGRTRGRSPACRPTSIASRCKTEVPGSLASSGRDDTPCHFGSPPSRWARSGRTAWLFSMGRCATSHSALGIAELRRRPGAAVEAVVAELERPAI